MPDQQGTTSGATDVPGLSRSLAEVGEQTRRLLMEWLSVNGGDARQASLMDPLGVASSFLELAASMSSHPTRMVRAQQSLWQDFMALWQNTALRMMGGSVGPMVRPNERDFRFRDLAWEDSHVFSYILQSYLLTSRWLLRTFHDLDGLDAHTRETVDFYTRQFINALSPSNFAATNPEVIRATIATGGENLLNGLRHLLTDLTSVGFNAVVTTTRAFLPGETVAATPGKVIYRNAVMEVIQYAPRTATVTRAPLLFVPPWSNKYYLVDLGDDLSWVRWATGRGHTVFAISWANPDEHLEDVGFEDYVLHGPVAALDAIHKATGETGINTVGYCLGGTLLAAAIAYLAARGDTRVGSATFLATMLDYAEPGPLGGYIDQAAIDWLADMRNGIGHADATSLSTMVSLLKENDLIWSFVVNNYLLGHDTFPADLLRWNADTTRMPPALHCFYLDTLFRKNQLIEPGGITIRGEPVDLRCITVPAYFVAAREDHIAPWQSVFKGARQWPTPARFTLAASGHVTGIVNPPAANRYCHWTSARHLPSQPEHWLAGAAQRPGSWWPHWDAWIKRLGKHPRVPARQPGAGGLDILDDAPGTYLRATA
ncbi:MAG: class I poly(R)-hydroxyalkanoic acid synthase [Rhodospirillales bacterium]|nr:class I poly(R)-hydroxyalkanoic acid synthase [Rhodospirillales bacterium]